jgi:hypothetical protein
LSPAWRRLLAAACLLTFALAAAARYEWRNLPRFLQGSLRWRSESDIKAGASGMSFWFDRDYASFLEAVLEATPSGATVAVGVPMRPPAYLYQAAFTLAPRRVVVLSDAASADYVAYYKDVPASPLRGVRIAGGLLVRR